ncbi:hypothetical protein OK016_23275 [Vibrio chagasii]|nr:hypothetical protein [Vibrio chagasii]
MLRQKKKKKKKKKGLPALGKSTKALALMLLSALLQSMRLR